MKTHWITITATRQLRSVPQVWQCWSGFSTDVERRHHGEEQYLRKFGRLPSVGFFIPGDGHGRLWLA